MSELTKDSSIQSEPQKPTLCVSCQQFYGNSSSENLCSKCYKDKYKAKLPEPEKKVAEVTKKPISVTESSDSTNDQKIPVEEAKKSDDVKEEPKDQPKPKQSDFARCWKCSKKVGLLGFKCKCNNTYCKAHRLPEEHECTIDFAQLGKERLAKDNIAIKPEKLSKI